MGRLKTLKSGLGQRPGSVGVRWTGSKLQTWRARILQRDGFICLACKAKGRVTPADEVDHVIPLEAGGTYDDGNAQSLCQPCHKAKTAKDRGYRSRPQVGLDGWPVDI